MIVINSRAAGIGHPTQPMGWPCFGPYVLGHATSARDTNISSGLALKKFIPDSLAKMLQL